MKKIENVKTGELFKKPGQKKVWIKGSFCRTNKGYECTEYEDISNYTYIKKGKIVETNW